MERCAAGGREGASSKSAYLFVVLCCLCHDVAICQAVHFAAEVVGILHEGGGQHWPLDAQHTYPLGDGQARYVDSVAVLQESLTIFSARSGAAPPKFMATKAVWSLAPRAAVLLC